eukprot:g10817.t1
MSSGQARPEATLTLLELQNLIKRDSAAYKEDFVLQYRHFESALSVFKLKGKPETHKSQKELAALISFLSHTARCFPKQSKEFPGKLLDLLTNHAETLDPLLRKTVVQCLIMLQNRKQIERKVLLPALFPLFSVQDRPLRKLIFSHIVNDIRKLNKANNEAKINNYLQNFMFSMVTHENRAAAQKSLQVVVELWRRQVWTGEKIANAVAQACFSQDTKLKATAIEFFLGLEPYVEEESEKELAERRLEARVVAASAA